MSMSRKSLFVCVLCGFNQHQTMDGLGSYIVEWRFGEEDNGKHNKKGNSEAMQASISSFFIINFQRMVGLAC